MKPGDQVWYYWSSRVPTQVTVVKPNANLTTVRLKTSKDKHYALNAYLYDDLNELIKAIQADIDYQQSRVKQFKRQLEKQQGETNDDHIETITGHDTRRTTNGVQQNDA